MIEPILECDKCGGERWVEVRSAPGVSPESIRVRCVDPECDEFRRSYDFVRSPQNYEDPVWYSA